MASKFASFFEKQCSPNSEQFNNCMKEQFNVQFSTYVGDTISADSLTISAEAVSLAALKINKGKAPGLDGIMIEHLLHCHPIIYSLLAKLFSIMLGNGEIPLDFGRGILIPLPKSENVSGIEEINNFRGITLSTVFFKDF